MKIKRKVEMNLPQLIEWGFGNDMRNKNFESEGGAMVYFDYKGNLTCAREFVPQDFFTIEVEEELTEDTFFKHLIKVTKDDGHYTKDFFKVKDLIYIDTEEIHAYIDGEYKLIWTHEKGLVE